MITKYFKTLAFVLSIILILIPVLPGGSGLFSQNSNSRTACSTAKCCCNKPGGKCFLHPHKMANQKSCRTRTFCKRGLTCSAPEQKASELISWNPDKYPLPDTFIIKNPFLPGSSFFTEDSAPRGSEHLRSIFHPPELLSFAHPQKANAA